MRVWIWGLLGRLIPADLFDVDLGDVDWTPCAETRAAIDRLELFGQVKAAMARLDGTETSRISLLTGFTADELADLGGVD